MKAVKIISILFAAIIVVLLGLLAFVQPVKSPAGDTIASSTVVSSDGHLAVTLPHAHDLATSPLAIEGTVTGGGWFFEASFPIKVVDAFGKVLGTGTANALSSWMSTGTVPFAASIVFTTPHSATGTLLLQNDNPSGLPENQKSLSIPIRFQ
jgi:hypothetical protein